MCRGDTKGEVESGRESITVDGKEIRVSREKDPSKIPWKELDVDIVLECTGFFASKEKAKGHIDAGAKRVLISAPAGNDVPTVVYGVNHDRLKAEDIIVSGASWHHQLPGADGKGAE